MESFEECGGKITIQEIPDYFVIYERRFGSYERLSADWNVFIGKYRAYITGDIKLLERIYDDPAVTHAKIILFCFSPMISLGCGEILEKCCLVFPESGEKSSWYCSEGRRNFGRMEQRNKDQYHITEKFIHRLPDKPISCIKLREQYKTLTAEYGCSCNFRRTNNCYPSPVLHAIKNADDDVGRITVPTSRTLSKAREKQVCEELNVPKKVQDMSARILELKKQKRGIDKNIVKLEKELEKIFDQAGVDCMEIEMGLLVRRKTEQGYEWLVEL